MVPRIARRRPDGLVEIRRRRLRDVIATLDAAVLLALLAGWLLFSVALVVALVAAPVLLAITGGFVLLGVWGGSIVEPRTFERASAPPTPRRIA